MEEGQFGFILEVAGNPGVFWKWRERAEYINKIVTLAIGFLSHAEYHLFPAVAETKQQYSVRL